LLRLRPVLAHEPVRPEPDVVEQAALPDDEHLLEDGDDPGPDRRAGRPDPVLLDTVELEHALVGSMDAGEDLDEGAFPRAVLAEDRVHLAGTELEGAVTERFRRAEPLGDAGDAERNTGLRGGRARRRRRPRRFRRLRHHLRRPPPPARPGAPRSRGGAGPDPTPGRATSLLLELRRVGRMGEEVVQVAGGRPA